MLSTSFGFRSAMRFTGASCVEPLAAPPEARVTAFWFDAMDTSDMTMPSTT